jgi:uncharacterized membrane protein YcaP (DUF421 family)
MALLRVDMSPVSSTLGSNRHAHAVAAGMRAQAAAVAKLPLHSLQRRTTVGLDYGEIFNFSVSPAELVLRGTVMFWFLFGIFRFILRRDAGTVGLTDFLFVVILGDAAQNAMIGNAYSTSDGMVLIATLVAWNYALDYLSFQVPAIARFTAPRRLCLVREGRPLWRNMRRELVTLDELQSKLREAGHADLHEVKAMYMESDGAISVVAKNAK